MTMDHAVEVPIGQHWVGMKRESRQLVRWDKWIDTRNGETQMEAPSEVRELLNQDMERASRSVKDILGTVASGLFIITTYASYIILVCGEYYSNGLFNPWGTKSIVLGGIATLLYSLVLWGFIKLLTTPPGFVPRRFQGTNPLCSDDEMLDLPQCIPCNAFKPLRVHHCFKCKVCVLRYDHHCPWVGQCIGLRNHKPYIVLLCYTLATCIFWLVSSYPVIHDTVRGDWNGKNHPRWYRDLFLATFGIAIFVTIGMIPLVVQHLLYASWNLTDVEYRRKQYGFSFKTKLQNWSAFCGESSFWKYPFPFSANFSHDGTSYCVIPKQLLSPVKAKESDALLTTIPQSLRSSA